MTLLIEVQVVGVTQLIIDSHRADEPPKFMTHRLGILANRVLEAVAALDQRKNIAIQKLVVNPLVVIQVASQSVASQSVASRKSLVVDLVAHRLTTILTGDRMVAGDAGTSSCYKHRERLDEFDFIKPFSFRNTHGYSGRSSYRRKPESVSALRWPLGRPAEMISVP